MDKVVFDDDGVHFKKYAIITASVYSSGFIAWQDVKEADPDAWPPELRLVSGEILFISGIHKEAFKLTCNLHNIPLIVRDDIWGMLLEPFLDTEFTADAQVRTQERLENCGFSHQEIDDIRAKVEKRMLTYNSVVWEWVHLGMFDLFSAYGLNKQTRLFPFSAFFRKQKKQDFYLWANEIAQRC